MNKSFHYVLNSEAISFGFSPVGYPVLWLKFETLLTGQKQKLKTSRKELEAC